MATAADDRSISIKSGDMVGGTVITGDVHITVYQASGVVRDEPREARAADAKIGPNPYKGLLAFHEEDAERFFGREEQTDRLWQMFRKLHDSPPRGQSPLRLLPVLGPSGSGKSSVARAGLIPELARRPLADWKKVRVVVLTPGSHPLEALAAVLARIATNDPAPVKKTREFVDELKLPSEDSRLSLRESSANSDTSFAERKATYEHDGLRRISAALPEIASTPLIVLVDQFEEIYSLCADAEERNAFVDNLLCAVSDPAANVSAIITLRTDFLGETQKHPMLNTAIAGQAAIIPAMNEDELRQAIAEPAKLAGRPLDEATVDLLIHETEGREGALPLLQFALTRIWEGLLEGVEPAETLKKIGGVGGALAGEAQRIYDNLPDAEKNIARRVFLGLVQLGEGTRDTRRRVIVASLVAVGEDPDQVEEVVRRFSAPGVRLITLAAEADGIARAEVTHEALFEHWRQLSEWLDDSRDDLRFQRRLDQAARHWDKQGRAEGLLWRRPDLDLLQSFHERSADDMTSAQLDFFLASDQTERARVADKERNRLRLRRYLRVAISAAVMATILAAVSFFLFRQSRKAEDTARNAVVDATKLAKDKDELARQRERQLAEANHNLGLAYLERSQQFRQDGKPLHAFLYAGRAIGFEEQGIDPNYLPLLRADTDAYIRAKSLILQSKPMARWANEKESFVIPTADDQSARTYGVDISRDRKWMTLASGDGTIRVRELATGNSRVLTEPGQAKAHRNYVFAVTTCPNSSFIASCGDEIVRVWSIREGKLVARLIGHKSAVVAVSFSCDSQTLATGSDDNTIRVWDLGKLRPDDDAPVRVIGDSVLIDKHEESVLGVTFHPSDRQTLASASADGTIRIWDVSDPHEPIKTLRGHTDTVWDVSFTKDGKQLASASLDKTIRLWDVDGDERELAKLSHGGGVTVVFFSSDDHRLVSSSWDGVIRVWDVSSGQNVMTMDGQSEVFDVAAQSDDVIVSVGRDGIARVWHLNRNDEHIERLSVGNKPIVGLSYSPDGQWLACASWDGTVWLWNVNERRLMRSFEYNGRVSAVAWRPDSQAFAAADWEHAIHLHEVDTDAHITKVRHTGIVVSIVFSPDGKTFASAGVDGKINVWNAKDCQHLPELSPQGGKAAHDGTILRLRYNDDGSQLISADSSIRIWDTFDGNLITTIKRDPTGQFGHSGDIHDFIVDCAKREIISFGMDNTRRVWDALNGKQKSVTPIDTGSKFAEPSPDETRIATISDDKSIRVWSTPEFRLLQVFQPHHDSVYVGCLAFSPDGNTLVYPGAAGTVEFVELESRRILPIKHSLFRFDQLEIEFTSSSQAVD